MKKKASSAFGNAKKWRSFLGVVQNANNSELERMLDVIRHEKMLSDKVVREGLEARGKLKKFMQGGI